MNNIILSYSVLEFFCWNPYWDQYLAAKMEEDKKKYDSKKKGGDHTLIYNL